MNEEQFQGSGSNVDPAPVHREVLRWISVIDDLPPLNERVLFCCYPDDHTGCGHIYIGVYEGSKTKGKAVVMETSEDRWDWLPCTHWMPLPEPPEFPV